MMSSSFSNVDNKLRPFVKPLAGWNVPRNGVFQILCDRWWVVDADGNPIVYRNVHPQCNPVQAITENTRDSLFPGFEVKQLPVVYLKWTQ